MDSWVTFFIDFMISHLWQGFLLVALLSLVLHIRKHDSAASRFTAWLIVLLVMMLMPLLVLLPEQAESSGLSTQPLAVAVESEFDLAWQQALGSAAAVPAAVGSPVEPASSGVDLARIGLILLIPLWLFLMIWQCRQLWRAWVSMRRSRDQSSPCDAVVQARLDELRTVMGIRQQVSVRSSPVIKSPQTTGIWRAVVLLPEQWHQTVSDQVLAHVLAHELAHVRRHDNLIVWLQFLARILFCFNPAVWYAIHQMNRERESACDDQAMALGAPAREYASSLVTVAESLIPGHGPSLSVSCLRSRTHLRRRISDMLDPRKNHKIHPYGKLVVAAVALSVMGIAFGASTWPQLPELLSSVSSAGGQEHGDREIREGDGLLHAAWQGDAAAVSDWIARGADPDETNTDRNPRTPLIAAARQGHLDVVRLLLESGVNVESHNRDDENALIAALAGGHMDLADYLLDAGANANAQLRGDGSPLIAAARHGNSRMVKRLLDLGADADAPVRGDGSPLIAAARSGDVDSVEMLIAAGADPERYVSGDEAPLFHAARNGHADVVELLIAAGADPSVEYDGDGTPLMLAIRHGHDDVVNLLMAMGASPDVAVRGDGTALIEAARRNDLEAAELLIAAGVEVNQSVRGDGNALINAARRGHLQMARLLIANGAEVNAHVRGDDTPLINAVWSKNEQLIEFLLVEGADPNQTGDYDRKLGEVRTPLNQAAGQSNIAEMLLAAGAQS